MTVKYPDKKRGVALFPGSFDPFTLGHLDIVKRGLTIFDSIVVAVGYNPSKGCAEDISERVEAIRRAVGGMDNVEVISYAGLTAEAAKEAGASAILRGVRSVSDFEYERMMAEANMKIGGIETVIMISSPEYSFLSSSLVRELKSFGHDVSKYLPEED